MLILIIAICLIVITWPFWAALIYGVFMSVALAFALAIKGIASLGMAELVGLFVVFFAVVLFAAWISRED